MNNYLWKKEEKEKKYSLWKRVKNFGMTLSIAGILFGAYNLYEGMKDGVLDQKERKNISYNLMGMLIGTSLFYQGDFKKNKLERELQDENKTNNN